MWRDSSLRSGDGGDRIMSNLLIDSGYDLIMSRGFARTDGREYTAQLIRNRLMTNLGEMKNHPNIGLPWTSYILKPNADNAVVQGLVRQVIEETPNVRRVKSVEISRQDRVVSISFEAESTFGDIAGENTYANGTNA